MINGFLNKIKSLNERGPLFKGIAFPYKAGHYLLYFLCQTPLIWLGRKQEKRIITRLLDLMEVPTEKYNQHYFNYVFYNSWNVWRRHFLEQQTTFNQKVDFQNEPLVHRYKKENRTVFLYYRHSLMTILNLQIASHFFKRFVGIGSINKTKYLIQNGQGDLPAHIQKDPFKYRKEIRRDQLRRMFQIMDSPEEGAINYFYDGIEGSKLNKFQYKKMNYRLSNSLSKFLNPSNIFLMVDFQISRSGRLQIRFDEINSENPDIFLYNLLTLHEQDLPDKLMKCNTFLLNHIYKFNAH